METKKNDLIYSILVIVLVALMGFLLLRDSSPAPKESLDNPFVLSPKIRPISNEDHLLGDPKAEIVIVEYSDTECPFCKMFHQTMHQIVDMGRGRVAWVYRHYPIEALHKKAFREALASECAFEQFGNDGFWKYIDEIYARTQSNDSLLESELNVIAEDMGLDSEAFGYCLETERYAEKIEADIFEGRNSSIQGTPTSYIFKNGEYVTTINGAYPLEEMAKILSSLLD